ncbi:hypothetical protein CERZMDRAFT_58138 [Cercospora zeae-maydis SCOH1-5]|uniref:N-acetylgalactosaminide beta-1,3-galactosyltransferase n=1 Tax=Cercospora zeae-maydis SCOH1-5 TaxID=717836 RepID=A0A6A6FIX9_9PEZI|nr:hypothetical protein CERZMDRAFT_58138 [Cercospora zeae-maydis SCOH1-5]
MKTGATEIYNRFPMHIETTLKCAPNYIILSDLDQTISGNNLPVHDVLKLVTDQTRLHHQDFDLYHTIQEYHSTGQDIRALSSSAGWDLDKWKFLPMLHYVWNLTETADYFNSTIDWFVMIETDTALSWLNLIHYLLPLDATKPQYIGAPAALVADGSWFAHGGSGVIMSRTAVEKVEEMRRTYVEGEVDGISSEEAYDRKWEALTGQICCGDSVMAKAFWDVGVQVASARPMIQGDTRLSLPDDVDSWCQPPVTFHHVTPVEVDEFWRFQEDFVQKENGGLWNETFKYKDVFMEFIFPGVTNQSRGVDSEEEIQIDASVARDNWDNMSDRWKDDPAAGECVQWRWSSQGKCHMDRKIRLGQAQTREGEDDGQEEKWTSGWVEKRVRDFVKRKGDCKGPIDRMKEELKEIEMGQTSMEERR